MNKLSHTTLLLFASFQHRLAKAWIPVLTLMLCGGLQAEIPEKVAEQIKKSTVRVVILAGDEVKGHGTGFIVSKQGHVVTNRHVIADAEQAAVLYCDGAKVFLRRAELLGVSSTADLAILKIDPIPSTLVVKIAKTELVAGQTVMTVGFPGAIDSGSWATLAGVEFTGKSGEGEITSAEALGDYVPSVFPGAVAKCMIDSGASLILHSAKISGGNSGGPLIDAEGRVCGINTALVPASMAGADYPISIHSSELVALARAHSVSLDVSSSKASSGSGSGLNTLLLILLAAFAVVIFLMILRKPRVVMVDAVSKLIKPKPQRTVAAAPRTNTPPPAQQPQAALTAPRLRLRGRDLQGRSYDIAFSEADFQRSGGKLVIGRNSDLSQLHLPHDSVSRQHATLTYHGGNLFVGDRNSGNGTQVNGRELSVGFAPVSLRQGDRLTLGEVELIFEVTR
jgi:pSer/pThr/pTyr-binding forkhead associated (FHA) protein